MAELKYFKTFPGVPSLKFETKGSACFDLCYSPREYFVTGYDRNNATFRRQIDNTFSITIMPLDRILVPTGIIFDIPEGYSLRIHPRSSVAVKRGLSLVNCEAIIDSDYFDETFLLITNLTENKQTIEPGTRLAQAELVQKLKYTFSVIDKPPGQKTERVGGLGSTGEK